MSAVLDSSVLLIVLHREPGWQSLATALPGSAVSAVNFSEVVAKLVERGARPERARAVMNELRIAVISFDEEQAANAGLLRSATRGRGLSLGDRACLALGMAENARVLTADRAWAGLDVGVEIEVIR